MNASYQSFLGNKDQCSSAETLIFRIFPVDCVFPNMFEKVQAGLPAPDTTSFSLRCIYPDGRCFIFQKTFK